MLVAFSDSCGGAWAQLLGREDLTRVLRLALVRMPPGARLNPRVDRDGFSLYRCRRGSHLHSNCNSLPNRSRSRSDTHHRALMP